MSTSSTASTSSHGVGLANLLGVLFVGLKLGHVISWPWKWVLAPFWAPWALILVLAVFVGLAVAIREMRK